MVTDVAPSRWDTNERTAIMRRMRAVRTHLGLTQRTVGERMGITSAGVSALEGLRPNRTRTNGDILLSTLQRYVRALGGRLVVSIARPGVCCDMMADQLPAAPCPDHGDRHCPDRVIMRAADGGYGLPVHDGGTSYIVITFCPWCGGGLAA